MGGNAALSFAGSVRRSASPGSRSTFMDLGSGLGHLTYSTLVHPADNWEQLWDSLQTFVPKVKARVSPNAPFGVCIRLAAPTAEHLTGHPEDRRKLVQFLADQDMYVYTANAFP